MLHPNNTVPPKFKDAHYCIEVGRIDEQMSREFGTPVWETKVISIAKLIPDEWQLLNLWQQSDSNLEEF